jgi:translation initiation factor 1
MARDDDTRLVYSTGGEPPRKPPADPGADGPEQGRGGVRIRLDRRPGGRVVTAVTGLGGPPEALALLARALKTACGAGGTVKRGEIELQGDQRDAVESELRARGFKPKRAGG